ncbi:hypothetical protein HYT74_00775 [Candidatus Daviesbacteria bacterium]|nr:hypothetical protein [Candidatus Daviesbacteria bacterium]
MSAEAPKEAGTTAPIPSQEPEGGFSRSLNRLFGDPSILQPTPKIVQSLKPILPEAGEPLDLSSELNGIINEKITKEQEVIRQRTEKAKQEAETELKKQEEEIRHKAEERIRISAHNARAREIAEESGVREFFSQVHARLVQDYPSAVVEEGWGGFSGRRLPQCELSQILSDEVFRDYFIRLVWKDKIGANGPIDRKSDEYQYAEAICGAIHDDLTFNQGKLTTKTCFLYTFTFSKRL